MQAIEVQQKSLPQTINISLNGNSATKTKLKAKTLVCPMCCRQYGTKSLSIHFPQCITKQTRLSKQGQQKNIQISQQLKQKILSKKQWQDDQIQQFNKITTSIYRQQMMVKCWNCERNFVQQAYEKHKKNCILINGKLNKEPQKNKENNSFVKPKVVMCYLCGRQFGTQSIIIHQPQCIDKFEKQQLLKPKWQQRQLPIPPEQILVFDLNEISSWTSSKLQQYNSLVSDFYNKKSLVQCQHCRRTFFPQSLIKHQKGCKAAPKLRRANTGMIINNESYKSPCMLMCYICGRQFGTLSLQIHQPHCINKWQNQQLKKPEDQRRILPQCPQQISKIMDEAQWTTENISKFNEIAFKVYKQQILQRCETCNRTFLPQALIKHSKSCYGSHNKTMRVNTQQQQQKINSNSFKKSKSFNKSLVFENIKEQKQGQYNLNGPVTILKSKQQIIGQIQVTINKKSYDLPPKPPILKKLTNVVKKIQNIQKLSIQQPKSNMILTKQTLTKNKSVMFQSPSISNEDKMKKAVSKRQLHQINLQQCYKCGRKFGFLAFDKHTAICKGGLKRQDSKKLETISVSEDITNQL